VPAERIPISAHLENYALASLPNSEIHERHPDAPAPGVRELQCSVGVMAYNEEANIAHVLHSILGQKLTAKRIVEVIVVASGCEDQTASIVADVASREPCVRLIEQPRREGKASAINLFISAAQCPVLVLVSADVIAEDDAFEALLRHFDDSAVGMTGGHATPVNGDATFLGHAVHLQWHLHDRIARKSPKLGEMVAFRNVIPGIPCDTTVDELFIQALISQLGYLLVYEPQAIVYNRGPATTHDFLRQRRRIHAGHLRVRAEQAYSASTMSAWRAARALVASEASFRSLRTTLWSIGTVGLEAIARILGCYDVIRGRRPPGVWKMANTTKSNIAEAINYGAHEDYRSDFEFSELRLEGGRIFASQISLPSKPGVKSLKLRTY
jgi:glycosyl transferase family 2